MRKLNTLRDKTSKVLLYAEKALVFVYYSTGAHLVDEIDFGKTVTFTYKGLLLILGILLLVYLVWKHWGQSKTDKPMPESKKGGQGRKVKKVNDVC